MNGADVIVRVNTGTLATPVWTTVGSQRDTSRTESTDAIDHSSKDSRNRRVIGGRYESEVSLEGLFVPTDVAYLALRAAMRAGTLVQLQFTGVGALPEKASALCTELEEEYPDQDAAEVSAEFAVDGAWTTA